MGEDVKQDMVITIVNLAHYSVKEFLTSKRISQGKAQCYGFEEVDANILIYNDCLAYLMEFDRLDLTPQHLIEFPLARYAATYWTQHARMAERVRNFEPLLGTELFLTVLRELPSVLAS